MDEAGYFLLNVHNRLEAHYDLDRWHWREETTPLEVGLGAILVQHTSWTNVERALQALRDAGALDIDALAALTEEELAILVRPVGTPLTKARRVQTFVSMVLASGGFEGLFARPETELRRLLLATSGIGPETADVILLYAARVPAIVHDAYTTRLFRRLGIGPESDSYDSWRAWLDERLPADPAFRRRHHAAIVVHCKETCRARPKCTTCPLLDICTFGSALLSRPTPESIAIP